MDNKVNASEEKALEEKLYQLRKEHQHLIADSARSEREEEWANIQQMLKENEEAARQIQDTLKTQYQQSTEVVIPRPPIVRNVWRAFLVGGIICTCGQIVILIMMQLYNMDFRSASGIASVTVVIVAAILTGIGIYDEIGRFGGAGSMVPISGFSNSIVSAALEWKSSGMIYGIGAKIFTIAGPVILYGTMASVFLGLIYYVLH